MNFKRTKFTQMFVVMISKIREVFNTVPQFPLQVVSRLDPAAINTQLLLPAPSYRKPWQRTACLSNCCSHICLCQRPCYCHIQCAILVKLSSCQHLITPVHLCVLKYTVSWHIMVIRELWQQWQKCHLWKCCYLFCSINNSCGKVFRSSANDEGGISAHKGQGEVL